METFKFFALFIFLTFISCGKEKADFDLTFFKWNIHDDYYLKFNSSDTVYLRIDNPIETYSGFALLNEDEKEKLNFYLSEVEFPANKEFSNNVDDGLSYAFVYKNKTRTQNLYIHAKAGPKEFWEFGNFLNQIKETKSFAPINKNFDLKEIKKMIILPPPPIIK